MKLYFGFGANRDLAMIKAITGKPAFGISATIKDFHLCIEELKDIPQKARELIAKQWGSEFCSYGIVRHQGGLVHGKLWLLSNKQHKAVQDWELAGLWSIPNTVKTTIFIFGVKLFFINAHSEEIIGQTAKYVRGDCYETYIVPRHQILHIANKVRVAF